MAEYQILGGKHFLTPGPESGKTWAVEEGTIPSEEVSLPIDSPARKATQVDFFIIFEISYNHLSLYRLGVSEWFQRNGKFVQFLEIISRRQD